MYPNQFDEHNQYQYVFAGFRSSLMPSSCIRSSSNVNNFGTNVTFCNSFSLVSVVSLSAKQRKDGETTRVHLEIFSAFWSGR